MATRIICRASDCIFWENKMCTSEDIIYDPDDGCLTYEILDDLVEDEEEWDDDELLDDDDKWDDEDGLFLEDDIDDDKWQI